MKNKVVVGIVATIACCVGIVVGLFLRSGQVPCKVETKSSEISDSGLLSAVPASVVPVMPQGRDGSPSRPIDLEGSYSISTKENASSSDDEEDRITRRGIIMQQSADEVRQAIIDNAKLDDTQIEKLDKAIEEMNSQMLNVSTKWADHIRETGTLDMDTRLRMQHDINGVSVAFSDKMDKEFPEWRGENVDLTRLVRVTVAFEPFRKIRSEILRGESGGIGGSPLPVADKDITEQESE